MNSYTLAELSRKISGLSVSKAIGRVVGTENGQIKVSGLTHIASLGDQVQIKLTNGGTMSGEVVQIGEKHLAIMPDGSMSGLTIGATTLLNAQRTIAPCEAWLGRVVDANGFSLDGKVLVQGTSPRALHAPPPNPATRRGLGKRLSTGFQALNTLLPIAKGQRLGLFAGSGVGKSTLLGRLANTIECDVLVVTLVGERGRELRQFVDHVIDEETRRKTIVVAATSDRPALERRRCVWTAMAIAEHFRDAGKSVLLTVDSVTRFAEAHREIAAAAGELPVLRGYPPSLAHMITQVCERSGPGAENAGDITALFSVLVAGSDMDEPVADILRGVLDGHIVLTREIAERGRFPAIDLLKSVSRSLPNVASSTENEIIGKVREAISLFDENSLMIRSGLYSEGTDKALDTAIKLWPELDSFLGEETQLSPDQSFDRLRLLLRRSGIN